MERKKKKERQINKRAIEYSKTEVIVF